MSWDMHWQADLGGPEPVQVGDLDANVTSNLSPMMAAAVEAVHGADEPRKHWSDFNGMKAAELAAHLEPVLSYLEANDLSALNPPNGWGSQEGLTEVVRKIVETAQDVPEATLWAWG